MVRIGWLSDSHVDPFSSPDVDRTDLPGAGERLTQDIRSLFETYGISDLYFNGDAVFQSDSFWSGNYAHSTPEYYDRFWELVDASGHGDNVVAAPGNHDTPLQYFVESDDRARLRYKKEYDGVTVFMMNTAGTGWVSGSADMGYGWTNGYVPYKDLRWLDRELEKAGDNAKVVYFHHHATLTPGDPLASSQTETQELTNLYWVCRNHSTVHDILSSYDKVVCPQGHTAQAAAEGSSNVDGVEYLYKKHYYHVYTGEVTTYAFLDVGADGVTVTTVDHNSGEENTILEKQF
ncbi:metallophosphoesterase [Halobellus sp. GM3]|uniref:metallophosphoesterase n=1 Tax=Halobellus sp. GM3 TaxID=3458410 RepID=UPI00403D5693